MVCQKNHQFDYNQDEIMITSFYRHDTVPYSFCNCAIKISHKQDLTGSNEE